MDEFLDKLPHGDFVVSLESVIQAIRRLKNKSSCGIDRVSAIHIKHGGSVLAMHLSLFMQMVFTQGVVPSSFCVGILTPFRRKGKMTSNARLSAPLQSPHLYVNYSSFYSLMNSKLNATPRHVNSDLSAALVVPMP